MHQLRAAPWHRQPRETEEAHVAFERYLTMLRPRKISGLFAPNGMIYPISSVSEWQRENRWKERAEAYDQRFAEELEESKLCHLKTEQRRVLSEHAEILNTSRAILCNELRKLLELSSRPGTIGHMRPGEITALLGKVIELDRLIMGEATSRVETNDAPNLRKLTDEELHTMRTLLTKSEE